MYDKAYTGVDKIHPHVGLQNKVFLMPKKILNSGKQEIEKTCLIQVLQWYVKEMEYTSMWTDER